MDPEKLDFINFFDGGFTDNIFVFARKDIKTLREKLLSTKRSLLLRMIYGDKNLIADEFCTSAALQTFFKKAQQNKKEDLILFPYPRTKGNQKLFDCALILLALQTKHCRCRGLLFTEQFTKYKKHSFPLEQKNCSLIRPLLAVSRFEIGKFCTFWQLPIYPDKTNQKISFLRNRIRKQLLPAIKLFFNSRIENVLLQFAEIVENENCYMNQITNKLVNRFRIAESTSQIFGTETLFSRIPMELEKSSISKNTFNKKNKPTFLVSFIFVSSNSQQIEWFKADVQLKQIIKWFRKQHYNWQFKFKLKKVFDKSLEKKSNVDTLDSILLFPHWSKPVGITMWVSNRRLSLPDNSTITGIEGVLLGTCTEAFINNTSPITFGSKLFSEIIPYASFLLATKNRLHLEQIREMLTFFFACFACEASTAKKMQHVYRKYKPKEVQKRSKGVASKMHNFLEYSEKEPFDYAKIKDEGRPLLPYLASHKKFSMKGREDFLCFVSHPKERRFLASLKDSFFRNSSSKLICNLPYKKFNEFTRSKNMPFSKQLIAQSDVQSLLSGSQALQTQNQKAINLLLESSSRPWKTSLINIFSWLCFGCEAKHPKHGKKKNREIFLHEPTITHTFFLHFNMFEENKKEIYWPILFSFFPKAIQRRVVKLFLIDQNWKKIRYSQIENFVKLQRLPALL